MRATHKYWVLFLVGVIFSAGAQADVPNTFVSGTTARAAEVNENFDALDTAIDSNSDLIEANTTLINDVAADLSATVAEIDDLNDGLAALPQMLVVDATGKVLPVLLDIDGLVTAAFYTDPYANDQFVGFEDAVYLYNNTPVKFSYWVNQTTEPAIYAGVELYFEQAGCAGQAYVAAVDTFQFVDNVYFFLDGDIYRVDQQSPTTIQAASTGGPSASPTRAGGCFSATEEVLVNPLIFDHTPSITMPLSLETTGASH